LELAKGKREDSKEESFEPGPRQGKSLQLSGFQIFSLEKAGVGVSGASRKSGVGFAGRCGYFF